MGNHLLQINEYELNLKYGDFLNLYQSLLTPRSCSVSHNVIR